MLRRRQRSNLRGVHLPGGRKRGWWPQRLHRRASCLQLLRFRCSLPSQPLCPCLLLRALLYRPRFPGVLLRCRRRLRHVRSCRLQRGSGRALRGLLHVLRRHLALQFQHLLRPQGAPRTAPQCVRHRCTIPLKPSRTAHRQRQYGPHLVQCPCEILGRHRPICPRRRQPPFGPLCHVLQRHLPFGPLCHVLQRHLPFGAGSSFTNCERFFSFLEVYHLHAPWRCARRGLSGLRFEGPPMVVRDRTISSWAPVPRAFGELRGSRCDADPSHDRS